MCAGPQLWRPHPSDDQMVITMSERTHLPRLFTATILSGVLLAGFGCGDEPDEPSATKTPATCAVACARQKELCQSDTDCELTCKVTADALDRCYFCKEKSQRLVDCQAKLDVCDADRSRCPSIEFNECIAIVCEPLTCRSVCLRQNTLCGTQTDCTALCDSVESVAVVSGCDRAFEEGLRCVRDKDVCDQDETACPATAFDACVQAFCQTRPTSSACGGA